MSLQDRPGQGCIMSDEDFSESRQRMLALIAAKTIYSCAHLGKAALSPRVMAALAKVPRHEFVPLEMQPHAYADTPLPVGFGKTISQPFIVAVMTDLLDLQPTDTVLEIGTGLGYQTAVLAGLVRRVYSVELIEELASQAIHRLARQHCANVEIKVGNGWHGWPEHAPFDKVIVTAAPELIPPSLIYQLKPGGKMVIPAGLPDAQQLIVLDKDAGDTVSTREIFAVQFSLLDDDS
ncbi:MAG TPA: protein-L-isoaspartate(D-aspartate) O-methyltransferase [Burkholderiaceae bacterium]|nr:protein-L-isoaspartate(D-aspartate) O-methyltransferase [Burkholderiaceae bacterium]